GVAGRDRRTRRPSARRRARRRARSHPASDARRAGAAAFLRARATHRGPPRRLAVRHRIAGSALPHLAGGATPDCGHTAPRDHLVTTVPTAIVEGHDLSRLFPMPAGAVTALSHV